MGKSRSRRNSRRNRSRPAVDPVVDPLIAYLTPCVDRAVDEWVERRDPLKAIAHQVRKQLELDDLMDELRTTLAAQDHV
jgi:hypothetical protein